MTGTGRIAPRGVAHGYLWMVPLLAAIAAHGVAPWGELVWDDQLLASQQMAAIRTLADVLVPPAGIPHWTYNYYRPVVVLSYVIDQSLFGRGASAGPHAMNLAYHLLCVALVWRLVRRLLAPAGAADGPVLMAALVFAVNPLHVESISAVSGRSDVLATLFLLAALLALLRWRDAGSAGALLGASFALLAALLAKEVALAGLLLVPLVLALAPREGPGPGRPAVTWAGAFAACTCAAIAYLWLRLGAGTVTPARGAVAAPELLASVLRALGYYVAKLAWPWPQLHFTTWGTVPGGPATVAILSVALAAAVVLLRAAGGQRRVAVIGLAWVPLTVAPALAVAVTTVAATPVAERYLYLPTVGLAILAGVLAGVLRAVVPARVAAGLATLVIGAAAVSTVARSVTWLDDLRLWSDALAKGEQHALPLTEFGKAWVRAGDDARAERAFRDAVEVAGTADLRAIARYNLGTIAVRRGDAREAGRLFEAALADDPAYALAHYGLGRARYDEGFAQARAGRIGQSLALLGQAEQSQRTALRLNPTHASAYLELARVLSLRGEILQSAGDKAAAARDLSEALGHVETAARLDPTVAARTEVQRLARRTTDLLQGRR